MKLRYFAIPLLICLLLMSSCSSEETSLPQAQSAATFAVDYTGYWTSKIEATPGVLLTLVLDISKTTDGNYAALFSVPEQLAYDLPTTVTVAEDKLLIRMPSFGISITVSHSGSELTGTYSQQGIEAPVTFTQGTSVSEALTGPRPQDPQMPYPYISEDVFFSQPVENFTLAGTVTRPQEEGQFPAIVLVSGSGSQDRNEEIMNHRPFLVLSDFLTRAGYVVLRYDDRGVGQSEGNPYNATTFDIAKDAEAALQWLKQQPYVDANNIGILGHSEGGTVAAILASQRDDIAFMIMLAGPGVTGEELVLDQNREIMASQGLPQEYITAANAVNAELYKIASDESKTLEQRQKELNDYQQSLGFTEDMIQTTTYQLTTPWYRAFLKLDPRDYLRSISSIPVMVMNGTKDTQVTYQLNTTAIKDALTEAGNERVSVMIYDGLNHLFQPAGTGLPNEYANIDTTIDDNVMVDLLLWLIWNVR